QAYATVLEREMNALAYSFALARKDKEPPIYTPRSVVSGSPGGGPARPGERGAPVAPDYRSRDEYLAEVLRFMAAVELQRLQAHSLPPRWVWSESKTRFVRPKRRRSPNQRFLAHLRGVYMDAVCGGFREIKARRDAGVEFDFRPTIGRAG